MLSFFLLYSRIERNASIAHPVKVMCIPDLGGTAESSGKRRESPKEV